MTSHCCAYENITIYNDNHSLRECSPPNAYCFENSFRQSLCISHTVKETKNVGVEEQGARNGLNDFVQWSVCHEFQNEFDVFKWNYCFQFCQFVLTGINCAEVSQSCAPHLTLSQEPLCFTYLRSLAHQATTWVKQIPCPSEDTVWSTNSTGIIAWKELKKLLQIIKCHSSYLWRLM